MEYIYRLCPLQGNNFLVRLMREQNVLFLPITVDDGFRLHDSSNDDDPLITESNRIWLLIRRMTEDRKEIGDAGGAFLTLFKEDEVILNLRTLRTAMYAKANPSTAPSAARATWDRNAKAVWLGADIVY